MDAVLSLWQQDIMNASYTSSGLERTHGSVLVYLLEHEEHSTGAQVVYECLVKDGWDVDLLVNVHTSVVLKAISFGRYDALGISIGRDEHLFRLADFILDARVKSANPEIVVLLSGAAITKPFKQYEFLGVDAIVMDVPDVTAFLLKEKALRNSLN